MSYGAIDDGAVIAQFQHNEDSIELVRLQMAESDRQNDNESGFCTSCGVKISPARLEAIPNARRCILCQSGVDKLATTNVCRNVYVP